MKKTDTFVIENLGCANCANKMEKRIGELEGVKECSIVFATKKLRVIADDIDALMPQMQKIVSSIEDGARILVDTKNTDIINEDDNCCCEEDHCKHDHAHETDHGHESDHTHEDFSVKKLALGIALFAAALIAQFALKLEGWQSFLVFIVSYVVLGSDVLLKAVKNIAKGEIFDENFLMCIATIGALFLGEYPEAVAVMLFYRVGEYFENRAVEYSRKEIMKAVDMRPDVVNLVTLEGDVETDAQKIVVGDILRVFPGGRIPMDGAVIEGESQIDVSPITGEPVPVIARVGVNLLSGSINKTGVIKMRVDKPLNESMVTRILEAVENAAANKPQIDRFITRFSKIYTPIVCAAALLLAVIPPLLGFGDWGDWVYRALIFLVVSCPCALVLSVPLAFFSGIGLGSRKGILFKGGASIEALSEIKNVIMDKTGTITKGVFEVNEISVQEGIEKDELLRIAASVEKYSTHPIAKSILTAAQNMKLDEPQNISEIAGKGLIALIPNSEVLCGSRALMHERGIEVPNDSHAKVFLAIDGIYRGSITISDVIKDDAREAIEMIKNLGLKSIMLTGDNETSANEVSKSLGIEKTYANMLPDQKLSTLESIRRESGSVMFVGDGINDAPVLAGSNVGAAMGSGADAAIEAADIVFMNSKVSAIPQSIDIARGTKAIAMQNIVLALFIKIAVMVLSMFGLGNLWLAVFADVGVSLLCVVNSIRLLKEVYISKIKRKDTKRFSGISAK